MIDQAPGISRVILILCAAWAVISTGAAAWQQDWTYDEGSHLEWTARLLYQHVSEKESNVEFISKTPIVLPNVMLGAAVKRFTANERWYRFGARLPGVLWLALLATGVYLLAARCGGGLVANLATTAVLLDPNFVAHASVVTADMPYAALTILTILSAVRFWEKAGLERAAFLGMSLGLLLTAKYTSLLNLGLLIFVPFLVRGNSSPKLVRFGGVLAALCVAWLTFSASYLFIDMGLRLNELHLISPVGQSLQNALPHLRLWFPGAAIVGVDRSFQVFGGKAFNVIALGRWYPNGVWFYFILLWLLKTPLPLLLFEISGLGVFLASFRHWKQQRIAVLLFVHLVVFLSYFSFMFRVQIGYRYVLMCLPLGCIIAASNIISLNLSRWHRIGIPILVLLTFVETVPYFGNPLSFTNTLIPIKRDAYRFLADSNIDWGQNYTIAANEIHERYGSELIIDPPHPLPGKNAFTLNVLVGVRGSSERYRWVRENLRPIEHVRHTHLIFDISNKMFDRFLNEERRFLPDLPVVASLCPSSAQSTANNQVNPGFTVWATQSVCLKVEDDTDLRVVRLKGGGAVGSYQQDGQCQELLMERGNEIWFRLSRGTYALCGMTAPELDDFRFEKVKLDLSGDP